MTLGCPRDLQGGKRKKKEDKHTHTKNFKKQEKSPNIQQWASLQEGMGDYSEAPCLRESGYS